ncbi:Hypothetical protein DPCES_0962 [Desulfitobacterium hafniense]|uniref:Uncharacterized protein n=1 Tax=Desulfitobacterium hafniense TaxID=49338 RepID=A0A098AW52_DESHA|nr:hypothetical protein [Desulfitobacterium hafniense]CDX00849.1 Hypothetical protein DPCES_0962 [Desulfitobacterium hafniense]
MKNLIVREAIKQFVKDYEEETYIPRTEADIQGYLFSLCIRGLTNCNLNLEIHLNYPSISLDGLKHKKVDIVLGSDVAIEIKFEADYPGVSKPVVFPKEAASDIERLQVMKNNGISHCHFVFLDEDGTHLRNFQKYTPIPLNWLTLSVRGKEKYILHLEL